MKLTRVADTLLDKHRESLATFRKEANRFFMAKIGIGPWKLGEPSAGVNKRGFRENTLTQINPMTHLTMRRHDQIARRKYPRIDIDRSECVVINLIAKLSFDFVAIGLDLREGVPFDHFLEREKTPRELSAHFFVVPVIRAFDLGGFVLDSSELLFEQFETVGETIERIIND